MSTLHKVVIVGAGQAGGWVAKTLRDQGFAGEIYLLGDESHPPYERPPLSKGVLNGSDPHHSTYLWSTDHLNELNINWQPNFRVTAIDRTAQTVTGENGKNLAYDALVLATGSRVRTLSMQGSDSKRVHYLRHLEDCAGLQNQLNADSKLLVVGGGWIGLEVAASANKLGAKVTVIEAGERLSARALPPEFSKFLFKLHQAHGVDVKLGAGLEKFAETETGIQAYLANGEVLEVNDVVVGIGILPNTELAQAAGLEVNNGIVTDAEGRTSDPHIFACGDVTYYPHTWLGRAVRLESWANAQNQAIATAKAVLQQDSTYNEVPWFWSDQYDVNLQVLGMPLQWPEPIYRGDSQSQSFSAFYLNPQSQIEAVIAINSAMDIKVAKRLMEQRKVVDAKALADTGVRLQSLLKA